MTFMTYIARRTKQFTSDIKNANQLKYKPQPAHAPRKKDVGDYWLGKTIGRGASGRVKLGIHKQTGEKVAIKMIARSHLVSSITTAKSVQRELAILQLVHHPHLVELKQVLQDSSYVYFVMEYLEGGELFHILAERGKFKESDARRLFYQMVSSLAWCHAHHICHRDLKPENILLSKSKKLIKIADFGMAAMNTNLKTSCGSPHYASPEIIKGNAYDGACTDVWSLGVILFALLSGHLPFDDENMGRLLGKIRTGRYRPLPTSLSTEAKHLIKKMLVVDPRKRITMNEILYHPWLTLASTNHTTFDDPLKSLPLELPMITRTLDLDGRIWETLKVLWQDLRQEEIIHALTSQGPNLQKLTCLLLQQREKRKDQEDGKYLHQKSAPGTPSMYNTYPANDPNIYSPPPKSKSNLHIRNGSDDVDSKCSPTTPYYSSISNVSCNRTADMPPTPKDSIFDTNLPMEHNSLLEPTIGNKCDHTFLSGNGDPCIGCPQQQENTHSATSANTESQCISRDQQLSLRPASIQQNKPIRHYHLTQPQHLQRWRTNTSDLQPFSSYSAISPLLVSYSENICSTSLHLKGNIQLQPVASIDQLSITTSTKCPSTAYNLIEQLHHRHSFSATSRQEPESPSLSSMFHSMWPLSPIQSLTLSTSTGSHWWSKTLAYVLHPLIKRQPKPVTFDCQGKHEYEVAGKIHQVLKEQLHGKISGRIYPNRQIAWNGTLKINLPRYGDSNGKSRPPSSRLWFVCQFLHQHGRHFEVALVYLKGDATLWNQSTQKLVATLAHYEHESENVMLANGW